MAKREIALSERAISPCRRIGLRNKMVEKVYPQMGWMEILDGRIGLVALTYAIKSGL